jgi:hypothetical protein
VLQLCTADRSRVDAHPVDQHRRVIALGAADEDCRGLAGTAVACDVDAGMKLQQRGDVWGERAVELLARDHDDRRQHVVAIDLGAGCGHDGVAERRGTLGSGQGKAEKRCGRGAGTNDQEHDATPPCSPAWG